MKPKSEKALAVAYAALKTIQREAGRTKGLGQVETLVSEAIKDIDRISNGQDDGSTKPVEYRLKDVASIGSWTTTNFSKTDSDETIQEVLKETAENELGWSEHYRGFEWRHKPTVFSPNPIIHKG